MEPSFGEWTPISVFRSCREGPLDRILLSPPQPHAGSAAASKEPNGRQTMEGTGCMAFKRRIVPAIALILMTSVPALGAVLDVPGAYPDLASALAAARAGDVIELAPGTYREHGLTVAAAVTLRGLGADAADVVLDGEGQDRLLTCEDVPGTVILQNLTLRRGLAKGVTSRLRSGGAVFAARTVLVAQDCIFEENGAGAHGGAIRFVDAAGRLIQCAFRDNHALLGGGAVDCSYGSSPAIERCEFRGNDGGWGGALSCRVDSSPAVSRSIFADNTANDMYGFGGGIFSDLGSSPALSGCTLTGNRASFGGALGCFQGSAMAIDRCSIAGNIATGAGAGLYCIDGTPRVTGSIIAFQQGSGVQTVGLGLPELGCSTVYGSTGSDITGPTADVPGAEPVASFDPGFCAGAMADGLLLLDPEAAPSAGACGTMGAWPSACALDTATVTSFSLVTSDRVRRLTWQVEGDHPAMAYRVTWTRPGQPERTIMVVQSDEGEFGAATSEPPVSAGDLEFRLYVRTEGGPWQLVADAPFENSEPGDDVPAAPAMGLRNWPNPFNPETTIGIDVGAPARLRVAIYGVDGRLVRRLADRTFALGLNELSWDGRDDAGRAMPSAAYIVKVEGADLRRTLKITLLK
jgi:hypothetical protein